MKKVIFFLVLIATILYGQTKSEIIKEYGQPSKITFEEGKIKYHYELEQDNCMFLFSYEFNSDDDVTGMDMIIISKYYSIKTLKDVAKEVLNKYGFVYLKSEDDVDYYISRKAITMISNLKYLGYNAVLIESFNR